MKLDPRKFAFTAQMEKATEELISTGLNWRELTLADAKQITDLLTRIENIDDPPYRTSPDEILEFFANEAPHIVLGGFDPTSQLRAFAHVRLRAGNPAQAICFGGVEARYRGVGIGAALVHWHEVSAQALLAHAQGTTAHVVAHVEDGMDDYANLLTNRGFAWTRTYYELRRSLDNIPPSPILPPFVQISAWNDEYEDMVRNTANQVAQESWGTSPVSLNQWLTGRTDFNPESSFIALDKSTDRTRIVGYLLCSHYTQDWESLGWSEGYIDLLGVISEAKDSTVGTALVIQAMNKLREQGLDRIATGVGSANHTGALSLFGELDFETVNISRMYSKEIPQPGAAELPDTAVAGQ